LGQIFYEWDHLETASQYIHRCIQLSLRCRNFDLLAKESVHLAWLERARHEINTAQEALGTAGQMLSECRLSPRTSRWVELSSAHWWITQGNLERASRLVQHLGNTAVENIPSARGHEYTLLVRLLIAEGEWDPALTFSECLLRVSETSKRIGHIIEILILQSLIFQGKKDMDRSLVVLGRALSLAQPEGYTRVFLDEGEPILKLLYQAKNQRVGGNYASTLISKIGNTLKAQQPSAQILIEPLTERELEVLRCIEAGYSNQDIADRLFISMPTVKRHISNIYSKLGSKSRTQAISLGRELGLLE
jgi:LuxR family maltose regulon positive regulatory protein